MIVGVPTETEKRAFDKYYGPASPKGGVKGLEAMVLDLSEPSHIQRVVQRIEELEVNVGRHLAAVVHNNQIGIQILVDISPISFSTFVSHIKFIQIKFIALCRKGIEQEEKADR